MQVIWEDDSAKTAAIPGYRLEQVPGHVMDMGNHDQLYPSPAGTRPVFWDEQNGVAYEGGAGQYHTDAITEHPELKARFGYDTIHSPPPGIYMGRKQMFTSPTVAWYRRPKDEHIQGVHDALGAQEEQEDDYDWSDQTPSESPTAQLPSPGPTPEASEYHQNVAEEAQRMVRQEGMSPGDAMDVAFGVVPGGGPDFPSPDSEAAVRALMRRSHTDFIEALRPMVEGQLGSRKMNCADASEVWAYHLNQAGHDARVQSGTYWGEVPAEQRRTVNPSHQNHYWVLVDGRRFDPTIDQYKPIDDRVDDHYDSQSEYTPSDEYPAVRRALATVHWMDDPDPHTAFRQAAGLE